MHATIGLGSNLGDSTKQLIDALHALQRLPMLSLQHHSRLFRSAPVGPQDQPDFVNAVAIVETSLTPLALLHTLQALEFAAGRQRQRHWGERTLDLDILLCGEQTIDSEELSVPHPHMANRAFVITPLLDIMPRGTLPDGRTFRALATALADQALSPLSVLAVDALIRQTPCGTGQADTPGLL